MEAKAESTNSVSRPTFWHKTKQWLVAVESALNYDEQAAADEAIRHLRLEVMKLKARIAEVEVTLSGKMS